MGWGPRREEGRFGGGKGNLSGNLCGRIKEEGGVLGVKFLDTLDD